MIELDKGNLNFWYWEETVLNFFFARPGSGLGNINRTYCRLDYSTDDEFETAIKQEVIDNNKRGYNCYQRLNTINHDFRGRAATDDDIFAVEHLLIDIDRKGKKTSPASAEELEKARLLALEIVEFLTGQDWPPPTIVMSGNGYHLYYAIDDSDVEPNPNSKCLRRALVKCLANVFDSATHQLDQDVYNESRLVKIVGTVAYKGEETPIRPYRRVTLLSRCSNSHFVTNVMMRAVIRILGFDPDEEIGSFTRRFSNCTKEPETPRAVAHVVDALRHIDADCDYDTWCRIIWALMSTGWTCAENLAREWSQSAPDRFEEQAFMVRVNTFNPDHEARIGLGTLFHFARAGGWDG